MGAAPLNDFGWVEEYVHVVRLKRFVHVVTLAVYDNDQLDIRHPCESQTAARVFREESGKVVEGITYRPGADRFVTEDGHELLNLFRGSTLAATPGGDASPWLDLLAHVVPDDPVREHILNFLAELVQHPGVKINHSILIGGNQGIGKDSVLKPIVDAIGSHNVGLVTPLELDSAFNDWLANRSLLIVQELAAFTNRGLANRLKPLLAEPPHVLRINRKFMPAFDVPNVVNVIAMTNSKRPLAIDEDDRRFFFYWSDAKPLDATCYRQYHDWVATNAGAVLAYLLRRDISTFDPKARPPMTKAKRDLIADSLPLVRQHLIAILDALPDLVTVGAVIERLPSALRSTSPRVIGQELRALGGRELRKVRIAPKTRPRLWAVRRADFYAPLSESALARYFDAQRQPVPLLPRCVVDLPAEVND